ncbi:MAG TPA: ABC transporter permease [Stellaceae bacterium]|nr:ABC transporter permease [Stellaceae bacterium]
MADPSIEIEAAGRPRLPWSVVLGAAMLAAIVLAAISAHWLAPFSPDQMHIPDRLTGPSLTYWAGTDEYGRDVFSRTLLGSRLSLFLGFVATAIALGIGVPLGLAAGYCRGLVDELMMRGLEIVMSFPSLLFVLLILGVFPPNPFLTAAAIGIVFVPHVARVTRSVALDLMSGEFVTAAHARGEHTHYILLRELLPNLWPYIVVEGSLRVAFAILLGAVLSFLGFGVQPPAADWGLMLTTARDFVTDAPWMALAPGIAMSLTVISVSLLGDGLREHLDPRARGRR